MSNSSKTQKYIINRTRQGQASGLLHTQHRLALTEPVDKVPGVYG